MRHFLTLALAPATLPPRMMQPTLECPLVAPSCHLHALAACLIGARLGAVPLPVITASAHPQLLLTMRAIQHSVAALDDRRPSSPQKAGQVLPIASLSAPEQALLRRSRGPPPKARGCYLGPSPFSAPGPPIALALPNETAAAPPHRSTSRRSNQIHEADGSNLGLSLVNDSGCVARCSPDSRCFCQPFTEVHRRAKPALAQHHINDLVEVLGELLTVPELRCFEPDEMFDSTREVIAKARVIRSAVLDELTPPGGAP